MFAFYSFIFTVLYYLFLGLSHFVSGLAVWCTKMFAVEHLSDCLMFFFINFISNFPLVQWCCCVRNFPLVQWCCVRNRISHKEILLEIP
jgi:hypothetical protein